jgi:hypothetical protein
VHDALLCILVQVHQCGAKAKRDLIPDCPRQQVVRLVQVSVQAAVGHQFVDEQEITFVATVKPSKELHKVSVPEPADDPHLGNKLLPTLTGALGHFLHGDV